MKPSILTGDKQPCFATEPVLKIVFLFLILTGFLFLGGRLTSGSAPADEFTVNCNAHKGACSQSSGNFTVTLEITPRPVKAMQDLIFKVSIAGARPAKHPHIDLGMPAMKMGPNQVSLKPTGPGTYEGTGVIVRCPSGKRTWFANIVIPGEGEVKFVFDVVY